MTFFQNLFKKINKKNYFALQIKRFVKNHDIALIF